MTDANNSQGKPLDNVSDSFPTDDNDSFKRSIDRVLDSDYGKQLSEEDRQELTKYSEDPSKYIEDARQGIYQRDAEHRNKS